MKMKLFATLSALATLFASLAVTSASGFWLYQPKEPKSLKK